MENNYLLIAAVFFLFCFLLYQEIKRANRDRLLFRIAAVSLASFALLFLLVPLTYKIEKNTANNELLLLTAGASQTLTSEHYFTNDSSVLRKYGVKQVSYLPDLAYYLRAHPEINHLKVYGYGLNTAELGQLKTYQYDFHPAASPAGISSISWPAGLKESDALTLQGTYNNISATPVKLLLEGLGSRLDSVVIKAAGKIPFTLQAQPKQLGKAVYQLSVVKERDTLEKEEIPFQVRTMEKTKILVLSSFPDFEYKFLKNWLFENNYQVIFRTRISKDKFSEDQLNMQALNSSVLTLSLLQQFDLVIADDEELASLSPGATAVLRTAIGNGLGLLIRLNTLTSISSLARSFKTYAATDSSAHSFSPVLAEGEKPLKPLLITQAFYIQEAQNAELLVKNPSGKSVLSTLAYGNGKITATALASTYNWMLTGQKNDYARFWSHVIRKTVKKQELTNLLATHPDLPIAGEQLSLLFETDRNDSIPLFKVNQTKVSPLQHTILPFSWKAAYWPDHAGWNAVQWNSGEQAEFYVYPEGSWKAVATENRLMQNLSHPKNRSTATVPFDVTIETQEKEVSKWWFCLLFLLAAAYLWFETKLL
jgi:hypothetical protein